MSYFARSDGTDVTIDDAYWYAGGVVFSSAFYMVIYHPFVFYGITASCKIRVACSGLIYQKALRISKSSMKEGQTGQIINLLSSDLIKLDYGMVFLYDVWKGPLEALAFFIIIYMEIGSAAFAGFGFLIGFIPLKGRRTLKNGP